MGAIVALARALAETVRAHANFTGSPRRECRLSHAPDTSCVTRVDWYATHASLSVAGSARTFLSRPAWRI